jgi:hypothetical protein
MRGRLEHSKHDMSTSQIGCNTAEAARRGELPCRVCLHPNGTMHQRPKDDDLSDRDR